MAAAMGEDCARRGAGSTPGAEAKATVDVQPADGQWKEGASVANQSKGLILNFVQVYICILYIKKVALSFILVNAL